MELASLVRHLARDAGAIMTKDSMELLHHLVCDIVQASMWRFMAENPGETVRIGAEHLTVLPSMVTPSVAKKTIKEEEEEQDFQFTSMDA